MRLFRFCSKGNALLETILFLPLGLFFLFVISDAGLCYVQHKSFLDALRSTTNSSAFHLKARGELSSVDVAEVVDELARELYSKLEEASNNTAGVSGVSVEFAVQVEAVELRHSRTTGALGSEASDVVYRREEPQGGLLSIEKSAPGNIFQSRENFLSKEIALELSKAPSRFAVPLGVVHSPLGANRGSSQYSEISTAIYLEARGIPKGLSVSYVSSVLGRYFAIQQQQLKPLRFQ